MSLAPQRTPAEQLATPVQFLKGVGPQRAELLAKLDLFYARGLAVLLPARLSGHERAARDRPARRRTSSASVVGVIDEVDLRNTGPGKSLLGMLLAAGDEVSPLPLVQSALDAAEAAPRARRDARRGEPKLEGLRWEMVHPRVELLADDEDVPGGRILPVYSLTEGINQTQMRRIVAGVVETHARPCRGRLSRRISRRASASGRSQAALPQIHSPDDQASLEQARRRFIYQELLVLQLALAIRKWRLAAPAARAAAADQRQDRRPHHAALSVRADARASGRRSTKSPPTWASRIPMNRLLQGDVGSGKTVVAMYAMLLAVAHGHQAALMAPTEVLARQHLHTLAKLLAASKVRLGAARPARSPRPSGAKLLRQDRRGRGRHRHRHARGHACRRQIGRRVRQARPGGDRRAAQVRRAAAGGAEEGRRRSALPGDDRHADPADRRR